MGARGIDERDLLSTLLKRRRFEQPAQAVVDGKAWLQVPCVAEVEVEGVDDALIEGVLTEGL